MEEVIARYLGDMYGRVTGPMSFRLILQPAMAAFFAIRGWHDAIAGRPAYFWAILYSAAHRRELLREGWKDIAKVFVLALVLDAIYQAIALRWFYPVESLDVAISLAILPYLLIRGLSGAWRDGGNRGLCNDEPEHNPVGRWTETRHRSDASGTRADADGVGPDGDVPHYVRIHDLIGPRGFAMFMIGTGLAALLLSTVEHRRSLQTMGAEFGDIPRSTAAIVAALIFVTRISGLRCCALAQLKV